MAIRVYFKEFHDVQKRPYLHTLYTRKSLKSVQEEDPIIGSFRMNDVLERKEAVFIIHRYDSKPAAEAAPGRGMPAWLEISENMASIVLQI